MEEPAEQEARSYDTLPKEVKDLYYSNEMLAAVQSVGTKYRLHVDQVGILEQEVGAVLLGQVTPQDFVPDLMKHVGVDRAVAAGITQEMNELLFNKIRGSLRQRVESSAEVLAPQPLKKGLPIPLARPVNPLTTVSISTERIV